MLVASDTIKMKLSRLYNIRILGKNEEKKKKTKSNKNMLCRSVIISITRYHRQYKNSINNYLILIINAKSKKRNSSNKMWAFKLNKTYTIGRKSATEWGQVTEVFCLYAFICFVWIFIYLFLLLFVLYFFYSIRCRFLAVVI